MKNSLSFVWQLLTFRNKASWPMSLIAWGIIIGLVYAVNYWITYGF